MTESANPLVSVALITYNGEQFLRPQLDSIFGQTYRPIEVIACDDCSTDQTPGILEEYRRSYGLQFFKNEKNLGYVKNFENTVRRCSGDFIAPADQDDIWLPQKIERLVKGINGCGMACSDAFLIDEKGCEISTSALSYSNLLPSDGTSFFRLLFSSFVIGCTTLLSRELAQYALPIPQGEKFHDWWFALVAATKNGISYIPEPLLLYRKHASNTLGLTKNASLFGKVFGFLYTKPDRNWYAIQETRLSAIVQAPQIDDNHRKMVYVARRFYQNRLHAGLHITAFLIACRHHRYIFPWSQGGFLIKAILGCLFR